jgi:hypothetical protein
LETPVPACWGVDGAGYELVVSDGMAASSLPASRATVIAVPENRSARRCDAGDSCDYGNIAAILFCAVAAFFFRLFLI